MEIISSSVYGEYRVISIEFHTMNTENHRSLDPI